MKKILLLLLIVVPLNCIHGQVAIFSKMYFGGKVGYGIANFESTSMLVDNFARDTYNNFSFGAIAGYKLTGRITIQVEGSYAQYGADKIIPSYIYSPESPILQTYVANSRVDHIDMNLSYIDIPLTVHYALMEGILSPYIYGGINWGINVSAKTTIVRAITESQVTYREFFDNITNRIKYNEIAPVLGGGIKINSGALSIFGDVRYKYGIRNLSNINNDLGFTNKDLLISGGIVFNL
jgi:hypothetical protein